MEEFLDLGALHRSFPVSITLSHSTQRTYAEVRLDRVHRRRALLPDIVCITTQNPFSPSHNQKLTNIKARIDLGRRLVNRVEGPARARVGRRRVPQERALGRVTRSLVHQTLVPALLARSFDVREDVFGDFEEVVALACPAGGRGVFADDAEREGGIGTAKKRTREETYKSL